MGHWRVDIDTRNDLVAGRRKGLVLGREAGVQCSRPKEKQLCDSITSSSLHCMNSQLSRAGESCLILSLVYVKVEIREVR
jgi:hypothetical protein